MDEGRKSQKKTASSSPTEDSMEVVEKIRLLEERIEKIEGQLATGVPRSEKAKLIAVEQGFKAGHTVVCALFLKVHGCVLLNLSSEHFVLP